MNCEVCCERKIEYKYIFCVDNEITGVKLYFSDEEDTRFAHTLYFCKVSVVRVEDDSATYKEAVVNSDRIKYFV